MEICSIDSGSDAATCPLEVAMMGVQTGHKEERLQCVGGSPLEVYGQYDIEFEFGLGLKL